CLYAEGRVFDELKSAIAEVRIGDAYTAWLCIIVLDFGVECFAEHSDCRVKVCDSHADVVYVCYSFSLGRLSRAGKQPFGGRTGRHHKRSREGRVLPRAAWAQLIRFRRARSAR